MAVAVCTIVSAPSDHHGTLAEDPPVVPPTNKDRVLIDTDQKPRPAGHTNESSHGGRLDIGRAHPSGGRSTRWGRGEDPASTGAPPRRRSCFWVRLAHEARTGAAPDQRCPPFQRKREGLSERRTGHGVC